MSENGNPANIYEYYGCKVFNDSVMRDRLPKDVYKSVKRTRELDRTLEPSVANIVANAMKDWAIENGATHFTHWFQPMTGITAEKHDAFLNPSDDGKVLLEFSGKELIKGEPDASSFPSGGLRATFEARGYTTWDPTSFAFIKDGTLCIPTAFCSYSGEALDKKTPLLRSMEAINRQALRILRLFGNTTTNHVNTTVGAEQEYFLIDEALYKKRKDIVFTGRTLFGAMPPKGQEMDDHYFGTLKTKVSNYMKELDTELWKFGIPAKTKHNEVAPAQHELAPVFETTNIATDHNQLTMEIMKKVAHKNGIYCLLHEKPFDGVNGSGKHNNWSLSTNDGINLLDPGKSPQQNIQFLTFLCAIIKAVDEYSDLLRLTAASAGNDHRLGGNEAPPAIVSIFLGDELTAILDALATGELVKTNNQKVFELGVKALPQFPKDTTDRNRTSPFAFTGNKFEFRMLGSSMSIACANMMLNTMVAESLKQFADYLEDKENFADELNKLLVEVVAKHKRVVFNGNNYSDEWVQEASKRGLVNYKTAVDVFPCYIAKKNVDLLTKHNILSNSEINARYEILVEEYSKTLNIEAQTMSDIVHRDILPACISFSNNLCKGIKVKKDIGINANAELEIANKLSELISATLIDITELDKLLANKQQNDSYSNAVYFKDVIIPLMNTLRNHVDSMEKIMPQKEWPMPTYSELLYNLF